MTLAEDMLDRAAAAALALAAVRPWREISLRDIALKAGVSFADLYEHAEGKAAVMAHLSSRFDRAALATAVRANGVDHDVHDRLFEAVMARIEAMEPHRLPLTAIGQAEPLSVARHLPHTARAMLEAAGVDATPPRLAAMTLVWTRVLHVWRDDEGALNRTMAEIDRRLKQMRGQLRRIGAGF